MANVRRCRLLELEDELVQHIFRQERGISLRHAAGTCKRLCMLARRTIAAISVAEEQGNVVANWPPAITFKGCRGLEYYAPDAGLPAAEGTAGLPLLHSLLPHVCSYWTSLRELALVLEGQQPPGPVRCCYYRYTGSMLWCLPRAAMTAAGRSANELLTQQLSSLTALSSLRHLQLYKTAPLQHDAALIAHLTQLTSLLLADQSYMPGHAAMISVDLQPLSSLTNLQSAAISGVCPATSATLVDRVLFQRVVAELRLLGRTEEAAARWRDAAATGADAAAGAGVAAALPASVTSLVLKNVDAMGLDLWTPQLMALTQLRQLNVEHYSECQGTNAFWCFPAPLLDQVASTITTLTGLHFIMASNNNQRTWAGCSATAARLPCCVSRLQHLRELDMHWCQFSMHSAEDWHALAALSQLTAVADLDVLCAPPADLQLTTLRRLSFSSCKVWTSRASWSLTATCPNITDFGLALHNPTGWLSAMPIIAAATRLSMLTLDFRCKLDEEGAAAFLQLGQQLRQLETLVMTWAGGPPGWLLPRLHTFTHIQTFGLGLHVPGVAVPVGSFQPWAINDTALLAHLSPVKGLTQLMLYRLPAVTSAVVLAVRGLMPKLHHLAVVECACVVGDVVGGEEASWEGADLQLALAALADEDAAVGRCSNAFGVEVFSGFREVFAHHRQLPCSVKYVTAHQRNF